MNFCYYQPQRAKAHCGQTVCLHNIIPSFQQRALALCENLTRCILVDSNEFLSPDFDTSQSGRIGNGTIETFLKTLLVKGKEMYKMQSHNFLYNTMKCFVETKIGESFVLHTKGANPKQLKTPDTAFVRYFPDDEGAYIQEIYVGETLRQQGYARAIFNILVARHGTLSGKIDPIDNVCRDTLEKIYERLGCEVFAGSFEYSCPRSF